MVGAAQTGLASIAQDKKTYTALIQSLIVQVCGDHSLALCGVRLDVRLIHMLAPLLYFPGSGED